METSKQFFEKLLGFPKEWKVTQVNFVQADQENHQVNIYLEYQDEYGFCTRTGERSKVFDFRLERCWEHLDMLQYKTYLYCRLPRVKNSLGEISTIEPPWSENGERHTHLFENKSISVLSATRNRSKTAELMKTSEEKITRIMHRGVNRGLERRNLEQPPVKEISIDEKSYGKGHKYISVLSDPQNGRILDVAKDRTMQSAESLLDKVFSPEQLTQITSACCDMWDGFHGAIKKNVLQPVFLTTNFM